MQLIAIITLIFTVAILVYSFNTSSLSCNLVGRHDGEGTRKYYREDDVLRLYLLSKCSKCGIQVYKDKYGNWNPFSPERK